MNQKTNKGITLIALVITIIVLLILAGVTLNIVLGDDGIIERAQKSGETYKEKEDEEIIKLAYTALKTDKLGNKIEEITADGIKTELKKTYGENGVEVEKSGTGYKVTVKEGTEEKTYRIASNGEVTKIDAEEFEFTINNITYTAEKWMTWEDWLHSIYCSGYERENVAIAFLDGILHFLYLTPDDYGEGSLDGRYLYQCAYIALWPDRSGSRSSATTQRGCDLRPIPDFRGRWPGVGLLFVD